MTPNYTKCSLPKEQTSPLVHQGTFSEQTAISKMPMVCIETSSQSGLLKTLTANGAAKSTPEMIYQI